MFIPVYLLALTQNCLNPTDTGRARLFLGDLEAHAIFGQDASMLDVWAPAHFEAHALITFADGINLDGIAVTLAKGTDCTELQCFIGWVHGKAHGQVCLDPGINLVFNCLLLLWGELVVVEVEA